MLAGKIFCTVPKELVSSWFTGTSPPECGRFPHVSFQAIVIYHQPHSEQRVRMEYLCPLIYFFFFKLDKANMITQRQKRLKGFQDDGFFQYEINSWYEINLVCIRSLKYVSKCSNEKSVSHLSVSLSFPIDFFLFAITIMIQVIIFRIPVNVSLFSLLNQLESACVFLSPCERGSCIFTGGSVVGAQYSTGSNSCIPHWLIQDQTMACS